MESASGVRHASTRSVQAAATAAASAGCTGSFAADARSRLGGRVIGVLLAAAWRALLPLAAV